MHLDLRHPPLRLTRAPRGAGGPLRAHPRRAYAGRFDALDAEGWTTSDTVKIRSRHRFRAAYIESDWTILPRTGRGRHRAHVLFPSWADATVTVVDRDGRRHRLGEGHIDLRSVAWLELVGSDGGYVVVPSNDRPPARLHLLHPEPQPSAPQPGPTVAVELLDDEPLRRVRITVRYAPARDARSAARVAARLGRA
jgi:hypothetical protein